jgi:TorA maturation chaperone TorD
MNAKPSSPPPDELAAARILALGFLGRAFYEPPTAALLGDLSADALLEEWPLPVGDAVTQEGLRRMTDYCRSWCEELLPELRQEHQRLFSGPDIQAPPWESVWRSEEHLMFEAHTLAVRRFYARFGLALPTRDREPDDHFGLELLFLGHLETLALRARREGDSTEARRCIAAAHDFLNRHVLRWAFDFLDRVYSSARSDYYRGLARLAAGTLRAMAVHAGARISPDHVDGPYDSHQAPGD